MKLQSRYFYQVLMVLVVLALTGCSKMSIKDKQNVDDQIDAALEEATQAPPPKPVKDVPPEVAQALMPSSKFSPIRQPMAIPEERFDISAVQVPATEFFLSLVKGTKHNVVTDPMLTGEVSLSMNQVTLEEALDAVQEIYGYEYQRTGNNYLISMPRLQTRMFKIDYLNMKRTGKSTTQVASSGLVEGSLGVNLDSESKEDFWMNLYRTLNALIGKENKENVEATDTAIDPLGRVVVVNPQSGVVIVRASPKDLRIIEAFLGQTQEVIVRQVVLEAKILEVELSDDYQQGINWRTLGDTGNWSGEAVQRGGGSIFSGTDRTSTAGTIGTMDPGQAASVVGAGLTSAFGGVFGLALNYANHFSTFIELLKTQGTVNVLSSPRVATMNNQKAVIKVGGDEFFVTNVKPGSETESGGITNPEIELKTFFSGIALDVTPQIDADNNVILHVHPTISQVSQENKVIDLGAQGTFTLPLAVSDVQESDNVVRARSGQIIVIGGLMKERTTDGDASVPGLGDLPAVGGMFRQKLQTRVKRELVIMIKPTVVESGQTWATTAQAARDRVRQMRRQVQKE